MNLQLQKPQVTSLIQRVTKRSGAVVPFDLDRIQQAIFAAAKAVQGEDTHRSAELAKQVLKTLEAKHSLPSVEEIQDCVESVLIKQGHDQTAKAYILYRAKRNEERQQKKADWLLLVEQKKVQITLENGVLETFDLEKTIQQIQQLAVGLQQIDAEQLVKEACANLYQGITAKELHLNLINIARSKIELVPAYSLLAGRLLLQPIYQSILGLQPKKLNSTAFTTAYQQQFAQYVQTGIEDQLLDPKFKDFDLEFLSQQLTPQLDWQFHYRSLQTLADRYLLKRSQHHQPIFELPQYLWMRVAMGLSLAEKTDREGWAVQFYHVLSNKLYTPSTPTLFNAGTTHAQLSSCFLNTTEDSLQGIFKTYADNAMLSKFAGGLGTDWTQVRSMGSRIKGTNGKSQGIIPFLKIFNDVALAVNQGGKRKGAMCAYLEMWHLDIEEFIESKKNTGDERRRLHDVHTAAWIPDLFMQRLQQNGSWTLFSPADVTDLHDLYGQAFTKRYVEYEKQNLPLSKTLPAKTLWRKTLTMLFETGHPWITFKDACNVRNPQSHVGVIHNSNLCTEITLNNSATETAVCNLGSLNLSKMIKNQQINQPLLAKTTKLAMRMLDNVIDINYYPTPETQTANSRHRPVGLGMMGYQDALYQMELGFASEQHLEFADELMENIAYQAISASSDLAQEKGTYKTYEGSKWDQGVFPLDTLELLEQQRGQKIPVNRTTTLDWDALKAKVKKTGMRNSNCLAIAPTATISNICSVAPCVEPMFRNLYFKENTDGSFVVINEALVKELQQLNLWNANLLEQIKVNNGSIQNIQSIPAGIKQKYQEAFEIDSKWVLKAAAVRGKWIDQSQSINIFLNSQSGKLLTNIYELAFELGLKTTYYLRTLSASQVRKSSVKKGITADTKPAECLLDEPDCEACQ